MIIRAFTGPRDKLTGNQCFFIYDVLRELPDADEVRTGCAPGIDTETAIISIVFEPDAQHILYVPVAPSNFIELSNEFGLHTELNWDVVYCERGKTLAESYRIRNERMLRGSDTIDNDNFATELHAFVRHGGTSFYPSGTWMTINIANKNKIPVTIHELPED